MLFGKGARTGNEIDMYVGQCKSDVQSLKMSINQSDMIEMQFAQLSEMAKRSGDVQLAMQFDMLKQMLDNAQRNNLQIISGLEQKLQLIDNATDKIQY
jgi:hypothetical protein